MRVRWTACVASLGLMMGVGHAQALPQQPGAEQQAEPIFTEQALFEEGTHGYFCFRIPAVIAAQDGSLLAFAEGRVNDCADDGHIDLVLRRSFDGGRTWGPLEVVIPGNGDTRGNPTPVLDRETGRIVLLSTWNAEYDTSVRRPFVSYSDDNGATWTEPEDISDDVRLPNWDWYATGPVHAIQLERGPHAGRLVAGANHSWRAPSGSVTGAHLLYSDDGGSTWNIGAIDTDDDGGAVKPQEVSPVELVDGRIYAAARDQYGSDEGNRAFAISSDGGETFDAPFATIPDLTAPVAQAATLRVRATDRGDDHNRIVLSAPAHPASREAMSIRSSYDEGATWESWNEGKIIHWGPSAYSDMVPLPDDQIGLLYEAGEGISPYESIRFARFNEAYLDTPNDEPPGFPDPPEPGPTTPDHARTSAPNTAYVRGNPGITDGPGSRFGQALDLGGDGDHVQVPFTDALDLDRDDFTVSTWFRYGESTSEQVIVWAYGLGSSKPQFWLRAEPGRNRLRALMTTESGTASITSPEAYNDGQWHHAALQRAGDRFMLWVDGVQVAAANAPDGSVTIGREFGIDGLYFGGRIDDIQYLDGALDEMRVYRRALSEYELDLVRRINLPAAPGMVLRLPLEQIVAE